MHSTEKKHPDKSHVIACHDCDLLQAIPTLNAGQRAYCQRCNALLIKQNKRLGLQHSLALTITGLILFTLANLFPFIAINAQGQFQESLLISASFALYQSSPLLGILVFLTTIFFPLVSLIGTLYVLINAHFRRRQELSSRLFRLLNHAQPWNMLEVFMLALLVSVVKLGDMAEIILGVALYAFVLLIFTLAALSSSLNNHTIWECLEHK